MDGIVWTARILAAVVLCVPIAVAVVVALVFSWLHDERDRGRPWEEDIYTEELNK